MKPSQFLEEIIEFENLGLSNKVCEYILNKKTFREAAKNIESFPVESVLTGIKIIASSRGSCKECGGRTVGRHGVHFDNQRRCVICEAVIG